MIKHIKFASIPVRDQQRALEFYTQKLGFEVMTDQAMGPGQRWIELKIAGSETKVVLFTAPGQESWIGQQMNVTFAADNVEKTYQELSSRGVEFKAPPAKQPWGTFAIFSDPDGNQFVLSSR